MQRIVLVALFSSFFGCSIGVPIDRSGNATCRSNGLVVFSGRIQMTGDSLTGVDGFPTRWQITGQDVVCEIEFDPTAA